MKNLSPPPWIAQREQPNPLKFFGGVEFWDNYYEHSPDDSGLWLKFFMIAEKMVGQELVSKLMYIRNTGAKLIRNKEYGYIIRPVIGEKGWPSMEAYHEERKCLVKNQEAVIEMLCILGEKGGL